MIVIITMATLWVLDKVFGKAFRKATPTLFVPAKGNAELTISAACSFAWSYNWILLDFKLATYAVRSTLPDLLPDKKIDDPITFMAAVFIGTGLLMTVSSATIPFLAVFRVHRKYATGSLKIINFNKK